MGDWSALHEKIDLAVSGYSGYTPQFGVSPGPVYGSGNSVPGWNQYDSIMANTWKFLRDPEYNLRGGQTSAASQIYNSLISGLTAGLLHSEEVSEKDYGILGDIANEVAGLVGFISIARVGVAGIGKLLATKGLSKRLVAPVTRLLYGAQEGAEVAKTAAPLLAQAGFGAVYGAAAPTYQPLGGAADLLSRAKGAATTGAFLPAFGATEKLIGGMIPKGTGYIPRQTMAAAGAFGGVGAAGTAMAGGTSQEIGRAALSGAVAGGLTGGLGGYRAVHKFNKMLGGRGEIEKQIQTEMARIRAEQARPEQLGAATMGPQARQPMPVTDYTNLGTFVSFIKDGKTGEGWFKGKSPTGRRVHVTVWKGGGVKRGATVSLEPNWVQGAVDEPPAAVKSKIRPPEAIDAQWLPGEVAEEMAGAQDLMKRPAVQTGKGRNIGKGRDWPYLPRPQTSTVYGRRPGDPLEVDPQKAWLRTTGRAEATYELDEPPSKTIDPVVIEMAKKREKAREKKRVRGEQTKQSILTRSKEYVEEEQFRKRGHQAYLRGLEAAEADKVYPETPLREKLDLAEGKIYDLTSINFFKPRRYQGEDPSLLSKTKRSKSGFKKAMKEFKRVLQTKTGKKEAMVSAMDEYVRYKKLKSIPDKQFTKDYIPIEFQIADPFVKRVKREGLGEGKLAFGQAGYKGGATEPGPPQVVHGEPLEGAVVYNEKVGKWLPHEGKRAIEKKVFLGATETRKVKEGAFGGTEYATEPSGKLEPWERPSIREPFDMRERRDVPTELTALVKKAKTIEGKLKKGGLKPGEKASLESDLDDHIRDMGFIIGAVKQAVATKGLGGAGGKDLSNATKYVERDVFGNKIEEPKKYTKLEQRHRDKVKVALLSGAPGNVITSGAYTGYLVKTVGTYYDGRPVEISLVKKGPAKTTEAKVLDPFSGKWVGVSETQAKVDNAPLDAITIYHHGREKYDLTVDQIQQIATAEARRRVEAWEKEGKAQPDIVFGARKSGSKMMGKGAKGTVQREVNDTLAFGATKTKPNWNIRLAKEFGNLDNFQAAYEAAKAAGTKKAMADIRKSLGMQSKTFDELVEFLEPHFRDEYQKVKPDMASEIVQIAKDVQRASLYTEQVEKAGRVHKSLPGQGLTVKLHLKGKTKGKGKVNKSTITLPFDTAMEMLAPSDSKAGVEAKRLLKEGIGDQARGGSQLYVEVKDRQGISVPADKQQVFVRKGQVLHDPNYEPRVRLEWLKGGRPGAEDYEWDTGLGAKFAEGIGGGTKRVKHHTVLVPESDLANRFEPLVLEMVGGKSGKGMRSATVREQQKKSKATEEETKALVAAAIETVKREETPTPEGMHRRNLDNLHRERNRESSVIDDLTDQMKGRKGGKRAALQKRIDARQAKLDELDAQIKKEEQIPPGRGKAVEQEPLVDAELSPFDPEQAVSPEQARKGAETAIKEMGGKDVIIDKTPVTTDDVDIVKVNETIHKLEETFGDDPGMLKELIRQLSSESGEATVGLISGADVLKGIGRAVKELAVRLRQSDLMASERGSVSEKLLKMPAEKVRKLSKGDRVRVWSSTSGKGEAVVVKHTKTKKGKAILVRFEDGREAQYLHSPGEGKGYVNTVLGKGKVPPPFKKKGTTKLKTEKPKPLSEEEVRLTEGDFKGPAKKGQVMYEVRQAINKDPIRYEAQQRVLAKYLSTAKAESTKEGKQAQEFLESGEATDPLRADGLVSLVASWLAPIPHAADKFGLYPATKRIKAGIEAKIRAETALFRFVNEQVFGPLVGKRGLVTVFHKKASEHLRAVQDIMDRITTAKFKERYKRNPLPEEMQAAQALRAVYESLHKFFGIEGYIEDYSPILIDSRVMFKQIKAKIDAADGNEKKAGLDNIEAEWWKTYRQKGAWEASLAMSGKMKDSNRAWARELRRNDVLYPVLDNAASVLKQYITGGLRHKYVEPAIKDVQTQLGWDANAQKYESLEKGSIPHKFLTNYIANLQGVKTVGEIHVNRSVQRVIGMFNRGMEKLPGTGDNFFDITKANGEYVSKVVTDLFYMGAMGFNPGSALKNLTQHTLTAGEIGLTWLSRGVAMSTQPKHIRRAIKSGIFQDYAPEATHKREPTHNAREATMKPALGMFKLADRINRTTAYLGAYAKAMKYKGDLKLDKVRRGERKFLEQFKKKQNWEEFANAYGKYVVQETQFLYTQADKPMAFRPSYGRLAGQFMTWPVWGTSKYVHWLRSGNVRSVASFVAAYLLLTEGLGRATGVQMGHWLVAGSVPTEVGGPAWDVIKSVPRKAVLHGRLMQAMISDDEGMERWLTRELAEVDKEISETMKLAIPFRQVTRHVKKFADTGDWRHALGLRVQE